MTRLTYSELQERFKERIANLTTPSGEGWEITLDFTGGDRQGFTTKVNKVSYSQDHPQLVDFF